VKAAVFMHLGNQLSDSDSENELWDDDSVESGDDNEVGKNAYSVFSFWQFTGEEEPSNWDNDGPPDGVDEEDSVEEVEDVIDDSLIVPSEAVKLERVLSAVAVEQGKPSTWVNAVTYKFGYNTNYNVKALVHNMVLRVLISAIKRYQIWYIGTPTGNH